MTIDIQLRNSGGILALHSVRIKDHEDVEEVISPVLAKLLTHSWTLSVGDTIMIVEGGE
jgi:hypothetical protein